MTFQSLVAKLTVVSGAFVSMAAFAQEVPPPPLNRVPEPETLALFALAAAIGAIVSRKRK